MLLVRVFRLRGGAGPGFVGADHLLVAGGVRRVGVPPRGHRGHRPVGCLCARVCLDLAVVGVRGSTVGAFPCEGSVLQLSKLVRRPTGVAVGVDEIPRADLEARERYRVRAEDRARRDQDDSGAHRARNPRAVEWRQ